jgi:hypothetical protein
LPWKLAAVPPVAIPRAFAFAAPSAAAAGVASAADSSSSFRVSPLSPFDIGRES